MADVKESWREVAAKAEALGMKLKMHLEQEDKMHLEQEDNVSGERSGSTRAAIEDLGNRLRDAFDSFGTAAKDPAVRADVSDIGVLLKDALLTTFTTVSADVGEVVRDVTGAVKKQAGGGASSPTPPTPGPQTERVEDTPGGEAG
jgi:hypothetical protein